MHFSQAGRRVCQCTPHGQPHEQFNTLGASFFDQFKGAELRGPFRVVDQTVHELQVKCFVDKARPFTIQLMT